MTNEEMLSVSKKIMFNIVKSNDYSIDGRTRAAVALAQLIATEESISEEQTCYNCSKCSNPKIRNIIDLANSSGSEAE